MSPWDERLRALFTVAIEALGYEYLGSEMVPYGKGRALRVYIDSEQGIGLDDCEVVSHQLSGILDVEDPIPGSYNLEVSSPGFDRPLFTLDHFERAGGRKVRLKLRNPVGQRRSFRGRIVAVADGEIEVLTDAERVRIPFADIEKARVEPD